MHKTEVKKNNKFADQLYYKSYYAYIYNTICIMTYDTVKGKLHDFIEHADQNKIMAIYTLLSDEIDTPVYNEVTLNMLESTRNDMLSGKETTYTLEQTIANIRKHRSNNGI